MGDVYAAQDRLLRRQVAVKVYRATALADRSRFDAEVHTLAALNHPGLVQVYDAGEHGGDGYVVLELVDGPTLRSILADRGTLPPSEAGALGAAMAEALAYVHAAGVVHRDVTPSNILCGSDGRPRLADFGIARLLDTTRVTAVATTVGTAAYMAPEQVEGRDVTPAADIYALGLVLWEALTGRTAFSGAGHEVAIARLVRDPDVETDVPAEWIPLLREMTARDPADRPSAAAVSDLLAALAANDARAVLPVVAAAPLGGDASVDGHAVTEVRAVGGGTTVMPAVDRPEPPALRGQAAARAAGVAIGRSRLALWVVAAIMAVVVLAVVAAAGDSAINVPTDTSEPTAVSVAPTAPTTAAPTTTVLPTTTEPPREGKGKGRGNGDD